MSARHPETGRFVTDGQQWAAWMTRGTSDTSAAFLFGTSPTPPTLPEGAKLPAEAGVRNDGNAAALRNEQAEQDFSDWLSPQPLEFSDPWNAE